MTAQARYRSLDLQLGLWHQVDPKAEAFYGWSPYHSNLGNPILNRDPEGDAPWYRNEATNEVIWRQENSNVTAITDEDGREWTNIGDTFATTDAGGNQITGNAKGDIEVALPEVEVAGPLKLSASDKMDIVANATGGVADVTDGLVKAAGEPANRC